MDSGAHPIAYGQPAEASNLSRVKSSHAKTFRINTRTYFKTIQQYNVSHKVNLGSPQGYGILMWNYAFVVLYMAHCEFIRNQYRLRISPFKVSPPLVVPDFYKRLILLDYAKSPTGKNTGF